MSFTTTLFKLIKAADAISFNGYEAEDIEFKSTNRLDPHDTVAYVEIDLSEFDQGLWRFRDQKVEVNSSGYCAARCTEDGVPHSFWFHMFKPITKEDLS